MNSSGSTSNHSDRKRKSRHRLRLIREKTGKWTCAPVSAGSLPAGASSVRKRSSDPVKKERNPLSRLRQTFVNIGLEIKERRTFATRLKRRRFRQSRLLAISFKSVFWGSFLAGSFALGCRLWIRETPEIAKIERCGEEDSEAAVRRCGEIFNAFRDRDGNSEAFADETRHLDEEGLEYAVSFLDPILFLPVGRARVSVPTFDRNLRYVRFALNHGETLHFILRDKDGTGELVLESVHP
jgi:hypothetical protein